MNMQDDELEKIKNKPESEIDFSDIPEFDEKYIQNLRLITPEDRRIFIKLDEDIFDWLKKNFQPNEYNNLINDALRYYKKLQT